jgi:hypothetical protein
MVQDIEIICIGRDCAWYSKRIFDIIMISFTYFEYGEKPMAELLIRNLEPEVIKRLREDRNR